jgi:hypothetical protein
VLAVPAAAAKVNGADVLGLAESVEGRAIVALVDVILSASEARPVANALVETIASRCAASANPIVRATALDLHALRGVEEVPV